ncbi:MAG TPA: thiamine pyrophosphate-dependent enzyme [Clostridia bacterium]|nr:thiamine pyrophosphate-dependent enzyme [Clostridia bacterium]
MNNTLEYMRENRLPHIWCPGCGNGTVIGSLIRAIDALGLDANKTVLVSGIGCSSRAPGYMKFDALHTTHGRALPFATGIKMANPELNVIVISGDGDAAAIGGNHLIHACRRNIDITMVIINNNVYGMTSGQYSPLTPTGRLATTAVYGNIDRTFDLPSLCGAAGATYVACASAKLVAQLKSYIQKGLENKGFSMIEAVSICPTYFGRRNKLGDAPAMFNWIKENSTMYKQGVTEYDKQIVIGEFVNKKDPEYTKSYTELIEKLGGNK